MELQTITGGKVCAHGWSVWPATDDAQSEEEDDNTATETEEEERKRTRSNEPTESESPRDDERERAPAEAEGGSPGMVRLDSENESEALSLTAPTAGFRERTSQPCTRALARVLADARSSEGVPWARPVCTECVLLLAVLVQPGCARVNTFGMHAV